MKKRSLASRLCRCIKAVRRTRKNATKKETRKAVEKAAIAICVSSVLRSKGKTLRRFRCKKRPFLQTQ